MAVCPFSAASLPIIAKLPAHLPLPVFLSKGRQPAPLQSSVGNLEGIPSHAIQSKRKLQIIKSVVIGLFILKYC